MKIEVYCDGSGNTFESDGGYGYRVLIDGKISHEGSGYLSSATNNVAELTAAIEGLKSIQMGGYNTVCPPSTTEITLISDSQLTLGYASGRYQCKALHLTPLYIELRKLYKELNCTQQWVKGHSGNEHNEAVDKLAGAARKNKGNI